LELLLYLASKAVLAVGIKLVFEYQGNATFFLHKVEIGLGKHPHDKKRSQPKVLAYAYFGPDISQIHLAKAVLDLCPKDKVFISVNPVKIMPGLHPGPIAIGSCRTG